VNDKLVASSSSSGEYRDVVRESAVGGPPSTNGWMSRTMATRTRRVGRYRVSRPVLLSLLLLILSMVNQISETLITYFFLSLLIVVRRVCVCVNGADSRKSVSLLYCVSRPYRKRFQSIVCLDRTERALRFILLGRALTEGSRPSIVYLTFRHHSLFELLENPENDSFGVEIYCVTVGNFPSLESFRMGPLSGSPLYCLPRAYRMAFDKRICLIVF
jgi:hypothetical protein